MLRRRRQAHKRGVNAIPIGQYAIGAMLVVTGRWQNRLRASTDRVWNHSPATVGESLRGQTLGIVGYGSIGREIARLASAHGMSVVVTKRRSDIREDTGYVVDGTGDPDGTVPSAWLETAQLGELAGQAEFVCVTVPLTDDTQGLIDGEFFRRMRSSAWLINVSRGRVIDEVALSQALRDDVIAGAILDVASREPLPESDPLWESPNLIITPHVSGMVEDPWSPLVGLFEANLRRFVSGQPLFNLVDADSGY